MLSFLSSLSSSVEPSVSIAGHLRLLAIPILIVTLLDLSVRWVAFVLIYTLSIIATQPGVIKLLRSIPGVIIILLPIQSQDL